MAGRYDLLDLLNDCRAILADKLNAKIAAIQAEKLAKGLTIALGSIDASRDYYRQTWVSNILNSKIALFYGYEEVTAVGIGEATAKELSLFFDVLVVDSGSAIDVPDKLLCYSRALEEVFEENRNKLRFIGGFKIKQILPQNLRLEVDNSEEVKLGGVVISCSLV